MPRSVERFNGIDLSQVTVGVGPRAFGRGRAYAREGRVLALAWDRVALSLTGAVSGTTTYGTTAFFSEADGGLIFSDGECSCPVGRNCKHVAAIVIAAAGGGEGSSGAGRSDSAGRPAPKEDEARKNSLWTLIETPAPAGERTLAMELSLRRGSRGAGLMARPMREGARGGWVNGSLTWSGLDSWQLRNGGYRPDQLALLRELQAIHHAGGEHLGYGYSARDDRLLDLADCDSPRFWALLDEAARIGLGLINSRAGQEELSPYVNGELCVDVARGGDSGAVVTASLRLTDGDERDDDRIEPQLFIGASGHGVVCAEPANAGRPEAEAAADPASPDLEWLRPKLVRLAKPAPAQLQRMVLDSERLQVPAEELDRFTEEIAPALRHVATITSADGSFTPPEVSRPALVLKASYEAGHALELGWAWDYRIGPKTRRVPLRLGASALGFRDRDAEREILAQTVLTGTGLERHGLLDASFRPTEAAEVTVDGIETMRLTTEVLPRLEEQGVTVEIVGEPADYRDVSGSLTIGVSTAETSGEEDWFDLGVTISVAGRELEFTEVFRALAAGESRLLFDDGTHLSLEDARLETLRRLIVEARALADSPSESLRISPYQAGLWEDLTALGTITAQAESWRRRAEALLHLDQVAEHDVPATLEADLRPYQRDGFRWLASLWDLGLGGILADDMGLGKTLQALALICHARERDPGVGPFLVVAPTSVVSNWTGEAERFTPGLEIGVVTDTLKKSGRSIEELASADVVIATYTLFRLEAEEYREVSWAGLILDEAQAVKNHQSKTYRSVRELTAPFKLALTGTPMENSLTELWSLLSITAPGLFPSPKRFGEHYARPIERDGNPERLALLRRRIKPLIKRRTKELVAADLPPKQEQTLEVDLHPRHRKLYETRLQRERQRILGLLEDFDRNRFTVLRSITLLRQLSIDPVLIGEHHEDIPCAKLGALVEQLDEVIGGGHRALVFSQYTGFLSRVRERLDQEGIGYCYLDGRTRKRGQVIEQFKQGEDPVFLISLKAGGFGLNLTEADYCFLLDPWWNPAAETQAIDRAHRIGQTRPVIAYRIISRGTIEEKVVALARRKAELFRGVMDNGDFSAGSLTAEDIRGLLEDPDTERRERSGTDLVEAA